MESDLYMHEQLMLLALRDDGALEGRALMHRFALGGALLAELLLRDRIRIDESKKAFVELVDRHPLGEPVLDECLDSIADAKRRARTSTWVQRLSNTHRLRHRIAAGLCQRRILRDDEATVLLFFSRKVYPTVDPRPERQLVERLRGAIFGDAPKVDPDIALVVTLANATGLLVVHFDKASLKRRKRRLAELAEDSAIGVATKLAVATATAHPYSAFSSG